MTDTTKPSKSIGIFGGGQLAHMLANAAQDLKFDVACLTNNPQDPVSRDPKIKISASPLELALSSETLCFESEFFDPKNVALCLNHNPHSKLRPSLESMLKLRDKLEQKHIFNRLGIAQAKFMEIRESSWEKDLEEAICNFPRGLVLKKALGGYDGKGNVVFDPQKNLDTQILDTFCIETFKESTRLYAEEKIDFLNELALVAVYSHNRGEFMTYPLTYTQQYKGACIQAYGPAVSLGLSPRYALEASSWALQIAHDVKELACFAIEMFLTKDGELLINELAPRVHNSGHFTQIEGYASQFHNHIRAIRGDALMPVAHTGFYLMQNLLVPQDFPKTIINHKRARSLAQTHFENLKFIHNVEWYGKEKAQFNRKMGHINFKFGSQEELEYLQTNQIDSKLKAFWNDISKD